MDKKNKFYLEASIQLLDETPELKEAASKKMEEIASIIKLPEEKDRQPDLQYMSAILVSSGTNLNDAHFLTSELVSARDTIASKALDVEHIEDEIIGHLYDYAFVDKENSNKLEVAELASLDGGSMDKKEVHVAMAAVVYKDRFPQYAEEIANNEWKVSMECYYSHYDVKVGDLILTLNECKSIGLASEDASVFGKNGKVIKDGKEIASGRIVRVLRGVCFSGCGIVKNPANPPSIIIETADENKEIVLTYDEEKSDNNVTSTEVEPVIQVEVCDQLDRVELEREIVSYAKELMDSEYKRDNIDTLTDSLIDKINSVRNLL